MRFGKKTEPEKCERCFRTKEEAIREQKSVGRICSDGKCTYKTAILAAIKQSGGKQFISQYCPTCGTQYYKSYSRFCHKCGKSRG